MSGIAKFKKEANFVGGEWIAADSGETIDVTNPATGEVIGTVPNCGEAETNRAIDAAAEAFKSFGTSSTAERVKLARNLHDALMDNQATLAELLTLEMGKPLFEAMGEVGMGAAYVLWFAEEVRRAGGSVIPAPTNDRKLLATRHPVGVVAAITPWNFPSSMLARKMGPALAAGCPVVAKPATATPFSALAWGVLAEEAGYPAGTVNVLTGSARAIGGAIMASPKVRKVTFTGSTEVGKTLIRQSADTVKKVSMELGGNAPFIVFEDADIDAAVEGAMVAKYRNMGQTCVCTNRFYVHSSVRDEFVEKLTAATAAMKIGNGMDDGVAQGPMIDGKAVEFVEGMIADAVSKGASIATGGKRHELGGTFFEPTVITDATADMRFATEEIFGPLSAVFTFDDEDAVIAAANDTVYGLASYAYTRDVGRVFRLNDKLEYGLIGINSGLITTPEAPFGGLKESGLGKEGGQQGLDDYLETKYIAIAGL